MKTQSHVGVDLHQRFCYLTAVDASGRKYKQGQVANRPEALRSWLREVPGPRQVVVEASGFWPAFARAVEGEADRLVMVHPQRVKAIASARLKNDRVDSHPSQQAGWGPRSRRWRICRERTCCPRRGWRTSGRSSYGC